MFEFEEMKNGALIKVVGVGGAGGNAVANMIKSGVSGVEFIVANTDAQVLSLHPASTKIHLGRTITKGLGAGGNPEIGQKAAIEDAELIAETLAGADIVFVTAGMGGGTGTGAAPVVAGIARDLGALTIGVVSTPFTYEGAKRARNAEEGLGKLKEYVDSYIVVENDRLIDITDKNITFSEAFKLADDVLLNGVQGISDTINTPGYINLDCRDVKSIMESRGLTLMGIGVASGENRDREALEKALRGPLLADANIKGAYGILVNITAGDDLKMSEVTNINSIIYEYAGSDTLYITGAVNDKRVDGSLKVVVVATGIGSCDNIKKSSNTVDIKNYIKKDSNKTEIINKINAIKQNDKVLMGFDEANNTDEYEIPSYLRKQID